MGDTKRWVVVVDLEGGLFIRDKTNHIVMSATTALTDYAVLQQKWPDKTLYLGLEISINTDHRCIAYQEMEAFVRALNIMNWTAITVRGLRMVDNPEEWPTGIGFLIARDFPLCSQKWEPVDHYKDPKNRIRLGGTIGRGAYVGDFAGGRPVLKKLHHTFSGHNQYQQDLVKDYLAGLDAEFVNPALAMLYFFKVLERIGKKEYGNKPKGTMTSKTLEAIIAGLDANLTVEEKERLKSVNRWRNTKSEAHLVTEGLPTVDELGICRRVAYSAILPRIGYPS